MHMLKGLQAIFLAIIRIDHTSAISWVIFQMSSWDGGKAMAVKENALQQLMELSHRNDSTTWSKVGFPLTLADAQQY